ncbi:RDD family protein [Bdellovibrio sp. SKB1291214]|uniref:RDD family protein n=1 Tax=Bdellovibrio sp. SKB1291214 TaxID=1732569 RepID=UPI000B517EEA|nr:RDD family protein [Bdellovibrio sp. SKB1291214]UYL09585.1 RDD family protein [Bdellovibrio sp. SKB1291214]
MLFPDLSAPEINNSTMFKQKPAIAFVADRFLALVLDFLIISPVVSLLVAGLTRQAKTFFLLNARSDEGVVAVMMIMAVAVIAVVLLQASFLYFLQATPGQFFLQLRVISYPEQQARLTFSQCMVRSVVWCFSFFMFALPFLGVLGHPLRRAFHEKASDTMVITLKKNFDKGPASQEQRLITSWMQLSFAVFAFVGFLGLMKSYHALTVGDYQVAVDQNATCKEIKDKDLSGPQRLDAALSLFLLKEISADCLHKEAELSLWSDPVNSQSMAYFAKFLLSEGSDRLSYMNKVCEDRTSSGCVLAQYLENPEDVRLADASQKLWVTQVLEADQRYSQHDYAGSLEVIEELQSISTLRQAMDKKYVRSIWGLQQSLGVKKGDRIPASVKESKPWLEDFKEKYGVQ